MAEQLLIGDVTALTGIASGRIRHYEKIGLLRAEHLSNGYRVFDVEQVLDLLRIDLMRSLGVSINDIQRLIDGGPVRPNAQRDLNAVDNAVNAHLPWARTFVARTGRNRRRQRPRRRGDYSKPLMC